MVDDDCGGDNEDALMPIIEPDVDVFRGLYPKLAVCFQSDEWFTTDDGVNYFVVDKVEFIHLVISKLERLKMEIVRAEGEETEIIA